MRIRQVAWAWVALALLTGAAGAQSKISIANMPPCVNGSPWDLYVLDAQDETDCDPTAPNGSAEAHCRCMDGVITAITTGGGGGAPTTLDYFVGTATGSLSAERVGTDTASIDVDLGTAGQVKFNVLTPVASASDLSGCTNCIGGTEIDESTLGTVPTVTAFATNPGDCSTADGTEFAWRINTTGDLSCTMVAGMRRKSWDNPPASAHAYDDEFDSTTKDAKWTLYGAAATGLTNTAVVGSIDYTASLTTAIYDLTTISGSLAFQSDNSSLGKLGFQQSYTAATNSTFFIKISGLRTNVSTNIEGNVTLKLDNTGDNNEWINVGVTHSGSGQGIIATVNNNGALTTTTTTVLGETTLGAAVYVAVWKKSDVYHWGYAGAGSMGFTYGGSMTKTGVTTLDRINIEMSTANETPSVVEAVDFFRYKASLDYGLVNP